MKLNIKDYLYITCLSLFPFIGLIYIMKSFSSTYPKFYDYILILSLIIFIITFIITIIYTVEHIRYFNYDNKNIIIKTFLLIVFNIFYLPIYYTKNILKSDIYIGIIIVLLNIGSVFGIYYGTDKIMNKYISDKNIFIINTNKEISFLKDEFIINLNTDYTCNDSFEGDSILDCTNIKNDNSFVLYEYNKYNYKSSSLNKAYKFQIDTYLDYLKENLVSYEKNNYLDTTIINCNSIKEANYVQEEKGLIIKSVPVYDDNGNIIDYEKHEEILYGDPIINGYNEYVIENTTYIKRFDIGEHMFIIVMEFPNNNQENYFNFLETIDSIQINSYNS